MEYVDGHNLMATTTCLDNIIPWLLSLTLTLIARVCFSLKQDLTIFNLSELKIIPYHLEHWIYCNPGKFKYIA